MPLVSHNQSGPPHRAGPCCTEGSGLLRCCGHAACLAREGIVPRCHDVDREAGAFVLPRQGATYQVQ
jgi:hypothetical protein